MKIIKQIFVILLFYIIGEIVAYLFGLVLPGLYIPGTIIGLLLLITVLMTGKLSMDYVDDVGTFLSNNMAFFFIPAAVSVIEHMDVLSETILQILVIIVISTVLSFLAIYASVLVCLKFSKKEDKEVNNNV